MENFFIDDKFCSDLGDLIDHLFDSDEDVINLPDDWTVKVEESQLEQIFVLDADKLAEILHDNNEDRYPMEDNEQTCDGVLKALQQSIDFTRLNALLPQMYYPTNKFTVVTKEDLIWWQD